MKADAPDDRIEKILAFLPQTQCELCQHPGCRPYAEAIVNGVDHIGQCHPGGLTTLHAIADIMAEDPSPWEQVVADQYKAPSTVIIDPEQCIGCTKCIQACPVDAIIGRSKTLHAVITTECTGCDLCLPACPMDCMHSLPAPTPSAATQSSHAKSHRRRYEQRNKRLEKDKQQSRQKHQQQKQDILQKMRQLQLQGTHHEPSKDQQDI